MRISRIGLAGVTMIGISVLAPVSACACEENTTDQSREDTTSIDSISTYYSCNTKDQCLAIAQYPLPSADQYLWKKQSMTYSPTPIVW
jgi:hypothetical protein